MDIKDIKELIALMRKNELSVFKMEKEGFKITLKKGHEFQPVMTMSAPAAPHAQAAAEEPAGPGASHFLEITSPMVGTFYSAASPDSPAYVSVGQDVNEETVVCIIEAMKVMNEIKAEMRGTVVEIVAENGKPVQYGQVLYRLK